MGERSAVNAWWNGAVGIVYSNAPEASYAEGKWPSFRQGGVVQVIEIFVQMSQEIPVIFSPEALEEFRARFWDIHPPNGLFVAQAFTWGSIIRAKPSVRFHRCTINVEGKNIC